MGVNLFMHSVRLVLGDWRHALRVTGLLYLIYAIPSLILGLLFPAPPVNTTAESVFGAVTERVPEGV